MLHASADLVSGRQGKTWLQSLHFISIQSIELKYVISLRFMYSTATSPELNISRLLCCQSYLFFTAFMFDFQCAIFLCFQNGYLSMMLKRKFDHTAETVLPTLINLIGNRAKV